MAGYASSTLNLILNGGIGASAPSIWTHTSTDAASVAQVTGYITDGGSRGMKVGDIVFHTDSDASPPLMSMLTVVTVSATYPGAVDLANPVTLSGASNSD